MGGRATRRWFCQQCESDFCFRCNPEGGGGGSGGGKQVMQLTVPPGSGGGQMLQVNVPGKGLMQVQVPHHLRVGQTFQFQC